MLMKKLRFRKWLALSIPLCFATYVGAQTAPAQNPTRDDNNIDTPRPAPDRDINHGDLSRFDQFLDGHREIAEQLRKDPSLANNRHFLKDHPALETYLRDNPDIRDGLKDDPTTFMSAEARFDRNEVERGELANFDRFLDAHRDVAAELKKNPSLVDNKQYLKAHPQLQAYLQDHPEIRQQIDRNPNGFMQQENSYDRFEATRSRDDRGRASFDQFLDSHHEIAEQLQKQPSLADNKQFLKDHPALQSYLQQNPSVRERFEQNPNAFMSQEAHWEHSGDDQTADRNAAYVRDRDNNFDRDRGYGDNRDRDHNNVDRDRNNGNNYDRDRDAAYNRDRDNNANGYDRDRGYGDDRNRDFDRDRDAQRHFGEFLGSHQDVAEQLSKNPSLANDHDYMRNHPELQEYLNQHPEVRQPLASNPDTFMKSAQQFNGSAQTGKTPAPTASTQPGATTQPKPYKP
jgi:hypothetical protein